MCDDTDNSFSSLLMSKGSKGVKIKVLYILWLWRLPNRPHFQGVQAEVLVCGELRAAVGGTFGSGTAVTSTKVAVEPQAEVAMLTTHSLMKQPESQCIQSQKNPTGLSFQGNAYNPDPVSITWTWCVTK